MMASRSTEETRAAGAATAALRDKGIRPTRQRVALAELLLEGGDRHVAAADMHRELVRAGARVSLATVYNTLHLFTRAGLLREVAVEPGRSFFDTNVAEHHHFLHEDTGRLEDIPVGEIGLARLPSAPPGTETRRIDVIVRVARSNRSGGKKFSGTVPNR